MTKLKLGPIADDKPVKVTVELPATLHRDLTAYAEILGTRSRPAAIRSSAPRRADAGTFRGDRPRIRESATRGGAAVVAGLTSVGAAAYTIDQARLSRKRHARQPLCGDHEPPQGRVASIVDRNRKLAG